MHPTLLYNALSYAGHREIDGPGSNPIILDAVRVLFPNWKDDSSIAWCSCWMHLIAENNCLENPAANGHPTPGMAKSWLTVGEKIDNPLPGDVAIFWRGSPSAGTGHVALYCNRIGSEVFVFGGNQSNAITLSAYSVNRLIGFRRLREVNQ